MSISIDCPVTTERYPLATLTMWVIAFRRAPDQDYLWVYCSCGGFHRINSIELLAMAKANGATEIKAGDYPPLRSRDEKLVAGAVSDIDSEWQEVVAAERLAAPLSEANESRAAAFTAFLAQTGTRGMNYSLFEVGLSS
jgi:hypothetical protein